MSRRADLLYRADSIASEYKRNIENALTERPEGRLSYFDKNRKGTREDRSGRTDADYRIESERREGYGRKAKNAAIARKHDEAMKDYRRKVSERARKAEAMRAEGYKVYDGTPSEFELASHFRSNNWAKGGSGKIYIAKDAEMLRRELKKDGVEQVQMGLGNFKSVDEGVTDSNLGKFRERELNDEDLGELHKPVLSPKDSVWGETKKSRAEYRARRRAKGLSAG